MGIAKTCIWLQNPCNRFQCCRHCWRYWVKKICWLVSCTGAMLVETTSCSTCTDQNRDLAKKELSPVVISNRQSSLHSLPVHRNWAIYHKHDRPLSWPWGASHEYWNSWSRQFSRPAVSRHLQLFDEPSLILLQRVSESLQEPGGVQVGTIWLCDRYTALESKHSVAIVLQYFEHHKVLK